MPRMTRPGFILGTDRRFLSWIPAAIQRSESGRMDVDGDDVMMVTNGLDLGGGELQVRGWDTQHGGASAGGHVRAGEEPDGPSSFFPLRVSK